ncbi:hypothetical protein [Methylobacterium sp. MA0201]|uniref:hypothetical protein n=1 Tax=Methylobacterium alsaeris TaxID=3344826 RepID=UPI003757B460
MAGDRILTTARYQAGDGDAAQAFPLGGDNSAPTFATDVPRALTDAELAPEASLFQIAIPEGRVLYGARRRKVGALTGDAARAVMHPFKGGTERTFILTDEYQAGWLFLADASGPLTVNVLEAATLGGAA